MELDTRKARSIALISMISKCQDTGTCHVPNLILLSGFSSFSCSCHERDGNTSLSVCMPLKDMSIVVLVSSANSLKATGPGTCVSKQPLSHTRIWPQLNEVPRSLRKYPLHTSITGRFPCSMLFFANHARQEIPPCNGLAAAKTERECMRLKSRTNKERDTSNATRPLTPPCTKLPRQIR